MIAGVLLELEAGLSEARGVRAGALLKKQSIRLHRGARLCSQRTGCFQRAKKQPPLASGQIWECARPRLTFAHNLSEQLPSLFLADASSAVACSTFWLVCVSSGVYLPLLWEQSFCWKSPIALGYTRGHFSALVAMENDGYDNRGAGANLNTDDDVTVTFLPLVDSERKLLHIHFLSAQEVGTVVVL